MVWKAHKSKQCQKKSPTNVPKKCAYVIYECPLSTGMFAGVQSKIIPILEPDFVAESAVQGIITNKPLVILPWWCSFLVSAKTMLPQRGFMYLSEVFGFNCSMDQFEGRKWILEYDFQREKETKKLFCCIFSVVTQQLPI